MGKSIASVPISSARFPSDKDLSGFDFASSDIVEANVRQLHRGEYIENAEGVILIGGSGTGKSDVATAIGVQAIEHHRRKLRFYSTGSPTAATSLKPARQLPLQSQFRGRKEGHKGAHQIDQSIAAGT